MREKVVCMANEKYHNASESLQKFGDAALPVQ